MGLRPATPGTIVVLAATILLVLVSVSAPILKSIYFLKANIAGQDIVLGCWGVCVNGECSKTRLGYSLDLEQLFGYDGLANIQLTQQIPNTLVKWLTYVLVLHPVAAVFAAVAVILGLLAHIRGFGGTCFTTCFASFGATISLIAFAFDLGLFIVAKKRIESRDVGGSAALGNALWMTLAAAIMLLTSGCFFGFGNCIIRDRQKSKREIEKMRPLPDAEYGHQARQALYEDKGPQYVTLNGNQATTGGLPQFPDRGGENVPLTSPDKDDDEWIDGNQYNTHSHGYTSQGRTDHGSIVSGVGEGYGRRWDGPISPPPIHPSVAAAAAAGGAGGAAAGLAADARARRGMPDPTYTSGPYDTYRTGNSVSPSPVSPTGSTGYGQQTQYGAFPKSSATPGTTGHSLVSQPMPEPSYPPPQQQYDAVPVQHQQTYDHMPYDHYNSRASAASPPPPSTYGPAPSYMTHAPYHEPPPQNQHYSSGPPYNPQGNQQW
ncbi:hypothetical protein OIV83_000262 [Microbotryomycetes sp. JL201]|nr:hypothetical protein OIV83_000262 [Microbotryomycetes sp. JL201]